jgi:hypothetical protein
MSATIQTMRSGGSQHPEEIMNFHTSRVVKGVGGIFDVDADSFLVSEEAVPAMSVLVTEGYAFIRKTADDMVYPVRLYDGDDSVAISSNSSGNDRIDAVVLYVDLGASANADITNVAKLVVVEGTPAGSPVAPTDGAIETAIGASNPYLRIADVTVADGATSILDASIADQRSEVLFISNGTPTADGDVANKKYIDDAILTAKSALFPIGSAYFNYSNATNPATLLGFGTWIATAVGRTIVGIDAGQTEFDTAGETGGAKTHTLTSAESGLPAHTHGVRSKYSSTTELHRHSGYDGYASTAPSNSTANSGSSLAQANDTENASTAHNNIQPYEVWYIWRRTA